MKKSEKKSAGLAGRFGIIFFGGSHPEIIGRSRPINLTSGGEDSENSEGSESSESSEGL